MQNHPLKRAIDIFQIIAAYQIIGGIAGWIFQLFFVYNNFTDISILYVPFIFIAFGLYTFSIYCGVLFFMNKRIWIKLSLINQFLQLFNFSILGFGFEYVSGFSQCIGVDFSSSFTLKFNFNISTWHILINGYPGLAEINFNVIALFIIVAIEQFKKRNNDEYNNNSLFETKL